MSTGTENNAAIALLELQRQNTALKEMIGTLFDIVEIYDKKLPLPGVLSTLDNLRGQLEEL